jgi:hypothetical protein
MVRRHRELVVGGTAAVLFGLLVLALVALYGSSAWAYDFAAYHAAVERLVATGSPYQASTLAGPFNAGPAGLYLYSPLPAVVLLPLAGLALNDAAVVFLALKLAALVASCALMPVSRVVRLAVLAVACISAPVLQDLNLGNASLIVTLLAVVSWRYLDRPAGSAAVTAALAVRPTMGLFLGWWLLRGRLRPLFWAAAVAAALFLASLPFVGLRSWTDYVTLLGNLSGFEGVYRNFALDAVLSRLGIAAPVAMAALFATYAIAAGAVVLSLRRDRELSFVVTLGATLLISPLLWDHYLTNLLVPAAFLAGRGRWPAVLLPLLCWLPQDLLPAVALAGMLLPFVAPDRGEPAGSLADRFLMRRSTPRSTAPA